MWNTMSLLYSSTAPTYSTTSQWEKYANVWWTAIWTTLNSLDIWTWTVSCWLYRTTSNLCVVWFYWWASTDSWSESWKWTWLILNTSNQLVIFVYWWDINTNVSISSGAWHNVILTQSNWTTSVIVDWQLKTTVSKTYTKSSWIFRFFSNPYRLRDYYTWRVDEIICENRAWNQSDWTKYYNHAKTKYGL